MLKYDANNFNSKNRYFNTIKNKYNCNKISYNDECFSNQ